MENIEIEYDYAATDKDTQSIEEVEIELEPFNIVVPLGYGLVAPSIGKLSKDIDSFGGKKDDLVISYYLMKEKLNPGEDIPQEIKDNIDKLNCVSIILTQEYAKGLKEILENYINEA